MKRKIALLLVSFASSQEIKTIDPITGLVVAGAMVIGALRTSTGKVAVGYMLGRASQTAPGKYLVARVQQHSSNIIKQKIKEHRALLAARLGGFSRYMKLTTPVWVKNVRSTKIHTQETAQSFSQRIYVDQTKAFNDFDKMKAGLTNITVPIDGQNAVPTGSKIFADVVQNNIKKETTINQGPFSTFVYNGDLETGKKQFWKGAFLGGIVGAGTVTYIHKKTEKDSAKF